MREITRFLTVAPTPPDIQLTVDLMPLKALTGAYLQRGDSQIVFETRMGCVGHGIFLGEIHDFGDFVPEVVKHLGSYVLVFPKSK